MAEIAFTDEVRASLADVPRRDIGDVTYDWLMKSGRGVKMVGAWAFDDRVMHASLTPDDAAPLNAHLLHVFGKK